jgi:flagellar basal body-associated protein FliL
MGPTEINENPEYHVPKKSRHILGTVIVLVALIVAATGTIAYLVITNKPKPAVTAAATPTPKIPSKDEVGQIMTSVDGKINEATTDQAAASAALNQASTPVKVDL